jgi:hypothetical protein
VLRRLCIENLVLIRSAELEPAPGLNAITGETGAGKTILAQAVGLLLGARGDAALVGPDGSEAYVEAELDLPEGLLDEEEFESLAELRPEGDHQRGGEKGEPGLEGVVVADVLEEDRQDVEQGAEGGQEDEGDRHHGAQAAVAE